MKIKVATLMAVYHADSPGAFSVALGSILQQRLSADVESRLYLVVDGPIPAGLDEVINSWQDRIYSVVRLPVNQGLAAALNALIATLEDEVYVFRMDADDWSAPCRYQAQLDYMCRHSDVDILGTDIVEVDQATGYSRRVSFAKDHEHAWRALCRRVPVAHPTVCFRRQVLDAVGGYPLSGTNEDIALWFRCAKAGFRFGNIHEPLLRFNMDSGFWGRRSLKKALSELQCYISGIWVIHGVTWRYVYPLLRFLFRLSPPRVARRIYDLPMRGNGKKL